jgi:hypothetical protein
MYFYAIESDQLYTWSDENPESARCRITETPPCAPAPTASAPSHPPRLSHRTLQTMRQTGMQMRRRPGPWPQVLFVGQLSQLTAANGLRAAGVLRSNGRIPGQLSSSARNPGGHLRDQSRTAAPPRGALRSHHEPSPFCPPTADRCGIGRHTPRQYAGSLARRRSNGLAHRGGSR